MFMCTAGMKLQDFVKMRGLTWSFVREGDVAVSIVWRENRYKEEQLCVVCQKKCRLTIER